MKLDTTDNRRTYVDTLIEKAFEFQASVNSDDKDEDNDWGGAQVVLDDLSAVEGMMEAEQIFIDTLARLKSPLLNDRDGQEKFVDAFADGFDNFISNVLLDRLYHAVNILNEWGFRSDKGNKFKDDFCDNLAPLVDVYENFDNLIPSGEDSELKIDTPEERLAVVTKLFNRAAKLSDSFKREGDRVSFGDILGLMALMEKLTAIQDLIRTEDLWEQTFAAMEKIEGVDEKTRGKFVSAAVGSVYVFMRIILMQRIEAAVNFAENNFSDRRLVRFQKDFRDTLTELLEVYEDIVAL